MIELIDGKLEQVPDKRVVGLYYWVKGIGQPRVGCRDFNSLTEPPAERRFESEGLSIQSIVVGSLNIQKRTRHKELWRCGNPFPGEYIGIAIIKPVNVQAASVAIKYFAVTHFESIERLLVELSIGNGIAEIPVEGEGSNWSANIYGGERCFCRIEGSLLLRARPVSSDWPENKRSISDLYLQAHRSSERLAKWL